MRGARVPAISFSSFSYPLLPSFISSAVYVLRRKFSSTACVESQHLLRVSGYDAHHHSRSSTKYWDKFYQRHQNKFFKDRHYLEKDWGQYFADDNTVSPSGKIVLEAGCGAGNAIFPLVTTYPELFVHACDFSPHAITLVKSHAKFTEDRMNVFVCNIAEDDLRDYVVPSSVDVVTLFIRRRCPLWYRTLEKY